MSQEAEQDAIRKARNAQRDRLEKHWPDLNPPDAPLDRVSFWQWVASLADQELFDAVESAKESGHSWLDIGTAFERTAESARHYRHYRVHGPRN